MTRLLVFCVGLFASVVFGSASAYAGYAHFIYDARSGKILTAENADEINHPASLTKMMTLYLTFEALKQGRLSWEQPIMVTPNAASKIPSKLGIRAGNPITVREAVLGMVVRSANDAAAAMGDHLGGSEERFGEIMTAKARELGMSRTVFRNASGLPDDSQVTTARDMATLAMALIRDYPREYQLFSMPNFEFRGKRLRGHNNLMYRYPGMDGVKTGFINASGYNIASAVMIDGRRVIAVMMGGKSARKRDDMMAALLDQYAPPAGGVPNSVPGVGAGALVAFGETKRTADGLAAVAPSTTRKEITLGTGGQPGRTSVASLGTVPRAVIPLATTAPTEPQQAAGPIWRIEVAKPGSRETASATLEKVLPLISKDFASVAPSVEAYARKGGQELFRSRLIGFASRDDADHACALLQAKSLSCFVVR